MKLLPDARILSCPRGGTSTLYYAIRQHPQFYPKDLSKEHYLMFWDWQGVKTLALIHEIFKHPEGTFNIDGSPEGLFFPGAPQIASTYFSEVKWIVLLRDPVMRAYENYWMVRKDGLEPIPSFEEAIQIESSRLSPSNPMGLHNRRLYSYLERGKYAKYMKRWFKKFPREQFFIRSSEDFFNNPAQVIIDLCDFLEVPRFIPRNIRHYWDATLTIDRVDRWYVPPINPDTKKILKDYFEPYNRDLYQLLGQDLGWEGL